MNRSYFLPGAGASNSFWKPTASLIEFPTEPYHFSWPGLGNEPHSPDINNIDDLVSLVLSQLDGPSNLIAQSMGGLVAVKTAIKAEANIKSLVLTATSAGLPMKQYGAAQWKDAYMAEYPNSSTWITEIQEDLTDVLTQLQIPTLLIWGDNDPISPLSVGKRLKDLMPNATLYIVAGGDHDLAITHAEEIAPLIAMHIHVL